MISFKNLLFMGLLSIIFGCKKNYQKHADQNNAILNEAIKSQEPKTVYDYTVKDIDGKDFNFSDLKGKKIMIVNVASKCGFTPQYEQLEELQDTYGDKGFTVIGFPANNFMSQEPGTNAEIKQFCTANFGVSFPMMAKISVKGDDMDPLYQFLTSIEKNGVKESKVEWNFQKYLIDPDGTLAGVYYSKTKPNAPEIIEWIERK